MITSFDIENGFFRFEYDTESTLLIRQSQISSARYYPPNRSADNMNCDTVYVTVGSRELRLDLTEEDADRFLRFLPDCD